MKHDEYTPNEEPGAELNYDYDDATGGRRPKKIKEHAGRVGRISKKLQRQGEQLSTAQAHGRAIAQSFWGQAFCRYLENYKDYDFRLPRGRTLLRSGSVIDLRVEEGQLSATVSGEELYQVTILIKPLDPDQFARIAAACAAELGSLVELFAGKMSDNLMQLLTTPGIGLLPEVSDLRISCNCLDVARMCEHAAAALYGLGARLDQTPELLLLLRGINQAALLGRSQQALLADNEPLMNGWDVAHLEQVFGIDIDRP